MNRLAAWIAELSDRASGQVSHLRHYHVVWLALYIEWSQLGCHEEARIAARNIAEYRREIDRSVIAARFWLTLAHYTGRRLAR